MNKQKELEQLVYNNDYVSLKKSLKNKRLKKIDLEGLFNFACNFRQTTPQIMKVLLEEERIDPLKDEGDFISACARCSKEVVKLLINDKRIEPEKIKNGEALIACSQRNTNEVLRYFLENKLINPSLVKNHHLEEIIYNEDIELLKLALSDERIDFNIDNGVSLTCAFEKYNKEVIEVILSNKKIYPAINNNIFLLTSVVNNEVENVKLLFETGKIDLKSKDNLFFIIACYNNYTEIVKLYDFYNIYDFKIRTENPLYDCYKYLKKDTIKYLKYRKDYNMLETLIKKEMKSNINDF